MKHFPMGTKFCSEDGTELHGSSEMVEVKDVISKFLDAYPDCATYINEDGSTEECFGNTIEGEVKEFSNEYPDALFQVDVRWDGGYDEPPTRYYIRGGKIQTCKATYQFEDYDMEKLK